MATIRESKTKSGELSFQFQVKITDKGSGKQITKCQTWKPEDNLTEKQARALSVLKAEEFENYIKNMMTVESNISNPNVTFKAFALEFIKEKKKSCSLSYSCKLVDIFEDAFKYLGNYKMKDITPAILQSYYDKVDARKRHIIVCTPKEHFNDIYKNYGFHYRQLRYDYNINCNTLSSAIRGQNVKITWAKDFAEKTKIPFDELFTTKETVIDYSYGTNHKYRQYIRSLFSYAKRLRIVQDNYASSEYLVFPKKPKVELNVMTEEQSKKLLLALLEYPDIKQKTAIMTFILTGFRRGEVAGLEWDDIDFNRYKITVSREITTVAHHGSFEKEPKTGGSRRTISVPATLINQLIEYKKWQDKERERLGDAYIKTNKIFTSQHGGSINPSIFTLFLKQILDYAGLPHFSLHSLRHTNITLQINAGIPMTTVSHRAGHARTSTTTDVYAYLLSSADEHAANVLDNMIVNSNEELKNMSTKVQIDNTQKILDEMQELGITNIVDYMKHLKNNVC